MSQQLSSQEYQKAVQFTFDYFDKNKNTFLDINEMKQVVGAVSGRLGNIPITDELINNVFKRLDLNRNGQITAANMYQVLYPYYQSN